MCCNACYMQQSLNDSIRMATERFINPWCVCMRSTWDSVIVCCMLHATCCVGQRNSQECLKIHHSSIDWLIDRKGGGKGRKRFFLGCFSLFFVGERAHDGHETWLATSTLKLFLNRRGWSTSWKAIKVKCEIPSTWMDWMVVLIQSTGRLHKSGMVHHQDIGGKIPTE